MTFKELTALFTVYSNNFKVMHWGSIGPKFDRIHNLSQEYYDMTSDDLDVLAEMGLRIGQKPATIMESTKILAEVEEHKFFVFDSFSDCDYECFVKTANIMLSDICKCLELVLASEEMKDPSNVGIKASLEGLHDKYDLQARYLNARRSK